MDALLPPIDSALFAPSPEPFATTMARDTQRNQSPRELMLNVKFALYHVSEHNGQVERGYIYDGAGFPALFRDINSFDSLTSFQDQQLWMTYHYHGLSIRNIAAYELLLPADRGFKSLGPCFNQQQWEQIITALQHAYAHTCSAEAYCVLCAHPPVLMVYFHRQAWEDALRVNKRKQSYATLTLLDAYSEEYAMTLRNANENAFEQYVKMSQLVNHDLSLRDLSGMCTPIPSIVTNLDQNITISAQPSIASHTPLDEPRPTKKRSASTASTSERPSKITRRLLVPNARPVKLKTAPDFECVSTKPIGDTKLETEKCFTCVQLNRSCSGTRMIDGRCEMCATKTGKSGSRKCYWRTPGIDTYQAAKAADTGAVYNRKNTRAGRTQRAIDRSAEDSQADSPSQQGADEEDIEEDIEVDEEVITSRYFEDNGQIEHGPEHLPATGDGEDVV